MKVSKADRRFGFSFRQAKPNERFGFMQGDTLVVEKLSNPVCVFHGQRRNGTSRYPSPRAPKGFHPRMEKAMELIELEWGTNRNYQAVLREARDRAHAKLKRQGLHVHTKEQWDWAFEDALSDMTDRGFAVAGAN